MVSLSRETNSLTGVSSLTQLSLTECKQQMEIISQLKEGGTFFGNVEAPEPDVQCLLQPVVGQEKLKKFTPLKTVIPAAFLLILSIVMEIVVLTLVFSWKNTENQCEPYFITLYSHVVYWAFSFITHFYFKRKHEESRLRGYLEFYQKSKNHSRIPFYIVSLWNTLLLLIETLFHDQYHDLQSHCESHGFQTPMNYMCFIVTLENIFMIPTIVSYIYKVTKFNRSRLCPDVQRDEWMASFVQDSYSAGEVGYRERDNHVEDLLEKQADLLRYLKEQNSRLVQKVLILNNIIKAQTESLQC